MKINLKNKITHNPAADGLRTLLRSAGAAQRVLHRKRNRQVWAFNAGDHFTGNPKWLFLYVCRYRPEIRAYWICDRMETVRYVRSLGYRACTYTSAVGIRLQAATDVFCVEAVKEKMSAYFPEDVVYLNLFHGVGCKPIEKKLRYGYLVERVAAKYIRYNEFLQRNMLFLVTSPLMEKHFCGQLDLREDMLIRGGYPRCIYQQYYEPVSTFDHDLLRRRHLPADTRIAAYVPTFRDDASYDFWGNAMPDMDRLINRLKEEHILFIFKIHPHMESDEKFLRIREAYRRCPWVMFWDNRFDIYEIFAQIDLGIVDYSSMFYDMLSGGVKHFIRYFFDRGGQETMRDFVYDIEEMTCGTICRDFEELLSALACYDRDDARERERIMDLFWSYSDEGTMDRIVDRAFSFRPDMNRKLPVLYSFSVFGALAAPSGSEENRKKLEELIRQGETVLLLCDRAMPEQTVREMLAQMVPSAVQLPLYTVQDTVKDVDSESTAKAAGETDSAKEADAAGIVKDMYLRAYLGFETYQFGKWIHFGSDPVTDGEIPRELGITTCLKQ